MRAFQEMCGSEGVATGLVSAASLRMAGVDSEDEREVFVRALIGEQQFFDVYDVLFMYYLTKRGGEDFGKHMTR